MNWYHIQKWENLELKFYVKLQRFSKNLECQSVFLKESFEDHTEEYKLLSHKLASCWDTIVPLHKFDKTFERFKFQDL